MEKSITEQDSIQTFRSPPRRRRSTFFERRESIIPLPDNTDSNSNNNVMGFKEKNSQELQRYYDKLLAEKEQWKKEVNSRRHKYHDLRQQYQIAAKAPSRSRISYMSLLNDDIEFMKGKIAITKLVDIQMKLHKSVKEIQVLFKKAIELDDVILRYSEDKVNKLTEHIINNSTVEI